MEQELKDALEKISHQIQELKIQNRDIWWLKTIGAFTLVTALTFVVWATEQIQNLKDAHQNDKANSLLQREYISRPDKEFDKPIRRKSKP